MTFSSSSDSSRTHSFDLYEQNEPPAIERNYHGEMQNEIEKFSTVWIRFSQILIKNVTNVTMVQWWNGQ